MAGTRDVYAKQMKALAAIKKKTGLAENNDERTVVLRKALAEWDSATLGDWEDAVVVAARREGLSSPKIHLLFAAVAGQIAKTTAAHTFDENRLKRASEIGSALEKLMDRQPEESAELIERAGGVKKLAVRGAVLPPKAKARRIVFERRS